MADLPPAWAPYAQFQTRLSRCSSLDSYAWGLEGALNVILAADFSAELTGPQDYRRAAASASRKRRHHLSRFVIIPAEDFDPAEETDLLAQLAARQALEALERRLEERDMCLLEMIADGGDYERAAHALRRPAGSLRNQMFRLRDRFAYLNA